MPYYKNIGTCAVKYHGVTINPDEVKLLEKTVMDKNLMQVEAEEENVVDDSPVRKRRSYNRKNVETKETETADEVEIQKDTTHGPEISAEEESN